MVCHLLPLDDVHHRSGLRHGPFFHRPGKLFRRLHRLRPSRCLSCLHLDHQRHTEAQASLPPTHSQELGLLTGVSPLSQAIRQVRKHLD